MSIPYGDQLSSLPETEVVRRALTEPSGRLKEGVTISAYLNLMEVDPLPFPATHKANEVYQVWLLDFARTHRF